MIMRISASIIGLVLLASGALASGEPMAVFLGERVPLVPADAATPPDALPPITFRAEEGEKGVVVVVDCDARNLPPIPEKTVPFRLDLRLGQGGAAHDLAVSFAGRPDNGRLPLTGDGKEAAAEAGLATQFEMRSDGTWRATLTIPSALVPVAAQKEETPVLSLDLCWRLAAGSGESATFPDTAALRLGAGEDLPRLLLRAARPTDVATMLQALADAPNPACGHRCFMRIHRICRRDDSLRGALAMALEHDNPKLRRAAASVWSEWPADGTEGLEALKTKAKAVLAAQPAPGDGKKK